MLTGFISHFALTLLFLRFSYTCVLREAFFFFFKESFILLPLRKVVKLNISSEFSGES